MLSHLKGRKMQVRPHEVGVQPSAARARHAQAWVGRPGHDSARGIPRGRETMYLTGSKTVSMDAQGRITLPAEYRDDFKESGNKVCLILVKGALWGFTPEGHQAWVESCFPEGFNPRSKKDKALRLALNARTVTVDIDKAGRVALGKVPESDLSRLGFGREVVIVGDADHFAVWNAQTWAAKQAELEVDLDALLDDDE